jgi:CRISPR-associated protein Cas1
MEEFRAGLAESVVLTLVNTQALSMDDFQRMPDGSLHLMRRGMTALIRGYEDRAERAVKSLRSGNRVTWRRLIREQAEAYAAHVEGGARYRPYVLDH